MKQQSIGYDSTNGSYIYLDDNSNVQIINENNQLRVYNLNDEGNDHSNQLSSVLNKTSINCDTSLETLNKINKFSSPVVPTLPNVDDIFQFLSQKIAKYCQVLSDLTNCEVFYKAQLHCKDQNDSNNQKTSKNDRKGTSNQYRSLYWGTHQMLFEYSHNNGIRYDKNGADSLIKINQRSFSNDVSDLIEEILNGPNFNKSSVKNSITTSSSSSITLNKKYRMSKDLDNNSTKSITKINPIQHSETESIKFKDCCVYLNRLDDSIVNAYLNEFESKHESNSNNMDILDLPDDDELYSDNINEKINNSDDKKYMEKNFNNSIDHIYICHICNLSFNYLTQFKLHHLKNHNPDYIKNNKIECPKCKNNHFESNIELSKHLLKCFYPDIYSCKSCLQSFQTYKEYAIHTKYIHSQSIYMCSYCNRKYKTMSELQNHENLLHRKPQVNYCELCFDYFKSRHELYEHYKIFHLSNLDQEINEKCDSFYSDKSTAAYSKSLPESTDVSLNEDFNELEAVLLNTSPSLINNNNSKNSNNIITLDSITIDQLNHALPTTSSLVLIDHADEDLITKPSKENDHESTTLTSEEKNKTSSFEPAASKLKLDKNDLIRGLIDRKHQCKWCSLRFYTKSQLKAHESTHNNAVLNCPVCDKEFHHKDRLSGHMKCHMEPSLECKVCGKKFKRLCNLYNHELVHGLTEHAFMLCQFCGRGFRSRRDYQNHVIANHRDLLMKCDDEDNQSSSNNNDSFSENEIKLNPVKKSTSKRKNAYISEKNDKKINQKPIIKMKKSTIVEQPSLTTTTVILREEYENIVDIEHDNDPYFTRTGIVQLNKEDIDEEIYDVEIEDINLNESSNNKSENMNKKNNNKIRNKIKRLRSSLNIEVVDDDLDNNHHSNEQLSQQYLNDNFTLDLNNNNNNNNNNVSTNKPVFHIVNLSDNIV